MLLRKCDGPACPRCGCQDVKIITPATGGFVSGVAICGYCGRRFSFTVPKDTTAAADQDAEAGDQARRRRKRF